MLLRNKRMLLVIGLLENVSILFYFKYTNFFLTNVNSLTGADFALQKIVLPIGISFYTFTLIAYLVDSYRGLTKDFDVLNYLLFITFFPHLVVGPIVHHKDLVPQFENPERLKIKKEYIMLAIILFSFGCAKKLLLADPLTSYAEIYFSNVAKGTFWQAWLSVLSYTISYYFDISSYADMAIGLGLLFGIKLPPNFNSPYKSRNFAEYWRRWHMTLSKFLSDYIFRSIYKKGAGSFNFYLAVMVTFFVSGFWHGAGWTFVVWGIVNGIFVVCAHFMDRRGWKFPFAIAWMLTFGGIMFTRVLFVSKTFHDSFKVYKTMIDIRVFSGKGFNEIFNGLSLFLRNNDYTVIILLIGMFVAFVPKNTTKISEDFKPNIKYAILAGVLFAISIFQMGGVSKFLYFQF